ncbi:MAG: GNAT family N-acetyltransferase [Treponema sp.]|nr:GNAT family N-acetyltransferase [Treponema sp.]
MEIKPVLPDNELWQRTIEYGKNCGWKAGPFLAKLMEQNKFSDWERVFVAVDGNNIAGYCTFTKKDCIPDVEYSPFIGFIFVGEQYRGKRISEKIILTVKKYAKELNFKEVYIASDHVNLYEKYGFIKIDEKKDYWNNTEKIYKLEI